MRTLRLEALEQRLLLSVQSWFSANIDLGSGGLNGAAWVYGDDAEDHSGWPVAAVGDVNDDGFDDLLIAAPDADPTGGSGAGEAYLLFGSDTGWDAWGDVDLSGNPAQVVRIWGDDAADALGYSAAGAGDVNGDGYDDIIVGAPGADPGGGSQAGEAYIIFGRGGYAADWGNINLNTGLDTGPDGVVRIFGDDAGDTTGYAVAGVGDVNDDGYDDVLIGAPGADPFGRIDAGECYLVFGREVWADIDMNQADPEAVIRVFGDNAGDCLGLSVARAGDVNDDGYADVLLGAPYADPAGGSAAGVAYLFFGHAGASTDDAEWFNLDLDDDPDGFTAIYGDDSGDYMAFSMAAAGDVNADGYDDIVIGAPQASPFGRTHCGEAYVILGRETWADLDFNGGTPDGASRVFGDDAGDLLGYGLSGGGDVNADGYDDIIIGAPLASPFGRIQCGESYIIFGREVWGHIDFDVTTPAGSLRVFGDDAYDWSGTGVAGLGDINGDGYDDVLIGAFGADPGSRSSAGESYIIFGTFTYVGAPTELTATEDEYFTHDFDTSAEDASAVVYSLVGAPGWLTMVDADTGVIGGTPLNDDVGEVEVTIRATGDEGVYYDLTFAMTVQNAPPEFVGAPTEIGGVEGQLLTQDFDTDDELEGGGVAYSIVSGPAWLGINATTGVVSGTPLNQTVESFAVTVRADDGAGGQTDHAFTISVPNVAPTIDLDEPAGPAVWSTDYTVGWTDLDVGDDASIDLYWDLDTNPGNNDAGSEGTTWGTIAAGLSENDLDAYDWDVDTPTAVLACYLYAEIGDGQATASDYTATMLTIEMPDLFEFYVGSIEGPGGAEVLVYDVTGPRDVSLANVTVKWGKDGSVSGISLSGDEAMEGLGLVVSGAPYFGGIKDGRKGAKGDMAFIAADCAIKSIQMKGGGFSGFDLNGLTLGGITFADDIDGDGETDDLTSAYCTSYVGSIALEGDAQGDIWIGGSDPGKGTAVKSFSNKTGGYHGDFYANGNVDKLDLGGDLASSIHVVGTLKSLALRGGDLAGDVTVDGGLGKLAVTGAKNKATGLYVGGTVTADAAITVNGIDPKKGTSVGSLSLTGDFLGELTTAGGAGKVQVSGGNFGGALDIGGSLAGLDIKGGKTGGGMMLAGGMIQADYLGKATLTAYETDNGGAEFGIYFGATAGLQVGALKLLPGDLPFTDGDFAVRTI